MCPWMKSRDLAAPATAMIQAKESHRAQASLLADWLLRTPTGTQAKGNHNCSDATSLQPTAQFCQPQSSLALNTSIHPTARLFL